MTIKKRIALFSLALFILLGGLMVPRATANAVECGVPAGTFRVTTQTTLFETQLSNSSTIRVLPVNAHVTRRGQTTNATINGRLPITHNGTAGWVNFSHLVSVPSGWC